MVDICFDNSVKWCIDNSINYAKTIYQDYQSKMTLRVEELADRISLYCLNDCKVINNFYQKRTLSMMDIKKNSRNWNYKRRKR